MSCEMGMIKYLLFIFNFIFAVCGLAMLTLGVVIHLEISDVTNHVDTNLLFPSVTLIIVGSIIFVISFFGCCGAIRESHCMTVTFASLLLLIVLIQVAVGVFAFVVVKDSENHIHITDAYRKIFNRYSTNNEDKEIVNTVQSLLNCCGVDSMKDFTQDPIPWSCCAKAEGQTCSPQEAYTDGCAKEIKSALMKLGNILGGIAIGIACVELLGIIFALCLANSIRNAERRGYRV